jgi:hypothetical protein
MKHEKKFSSQEQQVSETQSRQATEAREFTSVEELLRFDAGQTIVPPAIADRLQKSAAQINPPAARPWWKNLFGSKS